ncbi:helix-turn-helix domain-containing protein [Pseudomonas aeruginosa]|uniref:helix-turn-helix domain-containing protein n=1 Tax=Pseudomonas aeruginosa TaxID=287 RepID=UPI0009A3F574|nr:helix-turn-helix transcriptional regulator [Pseudomonas aeruginosa]
MEKRPPARGRPAGTSSFDPLVAGAFGNVVREQRIKSGLAQEKLALLAGIERAHLGKIERGESLPTLPLILRLSNVLEVKAAALIEQMEERLDECEGEGDVS